MGVCRDILGLFRPHLPYETAKPPDIEGFNVIRIGFDTISFGY